MRKNVFAVIAVLLLIGWAVYSEVMNQNDSQTTAQQKEFGDAVIGTNVGDLAPNFTLQDLEGNAVSLSDYKGDVIILNFWATWCPPCKAEMPHMRKIYDDYKEDHVVVLAVNLTHTEKSERDVTDFADEYRLTFPVVKDLDGDVTKLYKVLAYPTTYIVDRNGIIQQYYMGAIHYDMMKKAIRATEKS